MNGLRLEHVDGHLFDVGVQVGDVGDDGGQVLEDESAGRVGEPLAEFVEVVAPSAGDVDHEDVVVGSLQRSRELALLEELLTDGEPIEPAFAVAL